MNAPKQRLLSRLLTSALLVVAASALPTNATAELLATSDAVALFDRGIEPAPSPRVAALQDGSFVVAWTTDAHTSQDGSIRAQLFDPTGTATGEIIDVSTLTEAFDDSVDVSVLPNGRIALVWLRRGDPNQVLLRLASSTGTFLTEEIVVNDAFREPRTDKGPRIGVGSNTEFLVVWTNHEEGSPWGQRFDISGVPIGPNFSARHWEEGEADDAAAAYTGDEDFVVAWVDTTNTSGSGYCYGFSSGGYIEAATFKAGVAQEETSYGFHHPINDPTAPYFPDCGHAMGGDGFDMTADRRGRMVIAADGYYPGYFDYGAGYPHYPGDYVDPYLAGVFAERVSSLSGRPFRSAQSEEVDGYNGLFGLDGVSVANSRRGHYIVAWSRTYDKDPTAGLNFVEEVRLSGFGCDGSRESPLQFRVDEDATRDQYDVDVAATGDNTFIVTWVRRLLNDRKQVLAQPFEITGDCETCGDANNDQELSAIDALLVLDAAVGLRTCDLEVCDANGDERVGADDALLVLIGAIGLPVELRCPGNGGGSAQSWN